MKIAYVLDDDISTRTGVVNKIESKINLWEGFGHTVKVFTLRSKNFDSFIEGGVVISKLNLESGFTKKFLQQYKNVKVLDKLLSDFKPDMIYIREINYYPNLIKALKHSPHYIIEINSDEIEEAKQSSKIAYYYKKLTRDFLFQNASGFVSVSHELIKIESYSKFNKPSIVIGNGYNFDKVSYKKNSFSEPAKFVFIGTPGQPWHGTDKILFLAERLPEHEFHIIGPSADMLPNVGKNIIIHGYQEDVTVQKIVCSCDIGISTLALHRNDMHEASPLKSRQYLAQGLPIIIAYKDTDLPNDVDFILNIGNYKENIIGNIERIKNFVKYLKNLKPNDIRKQSKKYLDYHAKEKKRLLFFEEILNK